MSSTPTNMRLTSTGIRDCFEPGSLVSCTTCFDKIVEGEVMAFDSQKKLLVLKCAASNGQPSLNNVDIVNLSYVKNVKMLKEVYNAPKPQERINMEKLHNRVKRAIEEKRRIVNAMSGGVNEDGQKLFLTISKTIKDISWKGQDIVVYDDAKVVITPPYRTDNIKGNSDDKAYKLIRKVVEKHFADLEKLSNGAPSASGKTPTKETANHNNNNKAGGNVNNNDNAKQSANSNNSNISSSNNSNSINHISSSNNNSSGNSGGVGGGNKISNQSGANNKNAAIVNSKTASNSGNKNTGGGGGQNRRKNKDDDYRNNAASK